ncbi:MAG: putative transporter [Bacteroidales bacterium]|nr:putative transporter [Candidatus Scybalousia scybalohippi]MCQ2326068.1 putative transporter [Bacteroidales bacterium]
MNWLNDVFLTQNVAQSILLLAITIALGLYLGKFKVKGISLGITWILFVGIILSHFGFIANPQIMSFVKDFGLILFVYAIGLQVGPSFFSSLKQGGLQLNLLSLLIVVLGCITAVVIGLVTKTDLATMVGIMTGAVTNTPALGAAQQTLTDAGQDSSFLSSAYAVAYPLAVLSIIFAPMIVKAVCRIDVKKEEKQADNTTNVSNPSSLSIEVTNHGIDGKTVEYLHTIYKAPFVFSRIKHKDGTLERASKDSVVSVGDLVRVVTLKEHEQTMILLLGERLNTEEIEWDEEDGKLESQRVVVTKQEMQGKTLGQLHIGTLYNVTISRVKRGGTDLVATPNLQLQLGDRVLMVGSEDNIKKAADLLGNSLKRLEVPNLIPIFTGIFLGVLVGLIPLKFPGIPQPVKLGLAGGSLIVAILISRFGPLYKVVTYTTTSANMMVRDIGISLFLAAVGLSAGQGFVETIVNGGYWWVLYGLIITVLPIVIVSFIARLVMHLPYNTIVGLVAGAHTDPPALAFANESTETNQPAVAYATVYPLTMFLRIFSAQLLILFAL